jgi:hypothetical protein
MACDDAVLAETANPRGYAQCLISIAEKSFLRRGLALAQAVVNRMHQTSLRVSQILDLNRSRATRVWKPAVYSLAAFSLVCVVSLSHAPQLVTFEDSAPSSAALPMAPAGVQVSAVASNLLPKEAIATAVSAAAKTSVSTAQAGRLVLAHRSNSRLHSVRPVEASFKQPKADNFLHARTTAFIEDQATLQTILVVMQDQQYNSAGPTLWRLCVWRVVVFDSSHIPVETRIPAKQI